MEHKTKKGFNMPDRRFAWVFLSALLAIVGLVFMLFGYFSRNIFLPPLGAIMLVVGGGVLFGKRHDMGGLFGGGIPIPESTAATGGERMVLCFRDCTKAQGGYKEEMVPLKDIDPDTDIWENTKTGKKYYMQIVLRDGKIVPMKLSNRIRFSPETVKRIKDCPARELNSLQFGLLERLAPFAPVAALGVGFLLFVIVLG